MKHLILIGFLILGTTFFVKGQEYSWEKPHAKILDTGDLQWQPEAFKYIAGPAVRYIDYEHGNDNNDGSSTSSPWKHHPWDPAATGKAQGSKGIFTYVFKRGVVYRGTLTAKESGEPGNPIRLTSDPSWGTGEACIYGSRRFTSGWMKGSAVAAPNIPEPEKVWYQDIDGELPETKVVCELTQDGIKRVRLARTPNYRESPEDLLIYWPTWTKKEAYDKDKKMLWLEDKKNLVQQNPDYYRGGTVWSQEDAVVMCTLWAQKIKEYDPSKNAVAVSGAHFGGARCHYFIEDTPFLLDTTSEFWYDNKVKRLYLRLDKDKDPNSAVIEVAATGKLIMAEDKHDIVISGLTFGFTTSDVNRAADADLVAAIQLTGTCYNMEISNNKFTYVNGGISVVNPSLPELISHDIVVSDNDLQVVDDLAIGFNITGRVYFDKVKILSNRIYDNGARHLGRWYSSIPAISGFFYDAEIAGNIVDTSWGNGLYFWWGKSGRDAVTSVPFIRGLVHHNKASNTMIGCNDYGGIESWQGGPAYYYDNISYNCTGFKHFANSSLGYSFYIDGGFKQYQFNNIAAGKSWLRTRSGFMTVLGFYNMSVHNTGYRMASFSHGAVNDLDSDGHNAYLGNLADSVLFVFKTSMKPDQVPFESIGNNVASKTPFKAEIATTEALKKTFWGDKNIVDLETYKKELEAFKPQLATVGINARKPVLLNAYKQDYRPALGSDAIDRGVKFFASFPLYANVGEWNFYKHPADLSVIMAENFYMTDEYKNRNTYYKVPDNNLKAHGVTSKSFVKGKLEDWTEGALRFDGKQTYCSLDNSATSKLVCTDVDMTTNNFIIETVVRVDKDNKGGVLVSKYDPAGNGYQLDFDNSGHPRLSMIVSGKEVYSQSGAAALNDGKWHHLLAEVERSGKTNIYVDGTLSNGSSEGAYPDANLSLSNNADLLVGKGPAGNYFKGTIDFLRISKGTLSDARTTIAELYKWELDGPFLRDFTGKLPLGKARDAGAIEVE